MSEKKKLIIAFIVFIVTFLVFRELFSHWDEFKAGLFGN
jgi:hypothetical protein